MRRLPAAGGWVSYGILFPDAESVVQPVTMPRRAASASRQSGGGDSSRIRLGFRARPASARLFLDEKQLPGNPYEGIFDTDGARHVLRAEAPGHSTKPPPGC